MRIYVNTGHDIETASQMMTAIESSGGMASVSMTVSGPQPTAKSTTVKWEGISFINNIEYSNDGMELVAVNFYHGAIFTKQAVALCLI